MPRWLWWAPLGLLVLAFALIGLRYGWIAATTTETDVINRYATRYIKEHGGTAALTDCVAYPGTAYPGIWMVVSCTPTGSEGPGRYEYFVNRLGGLEYRNGPVSPSLTGPET